MVVRKSDNVTKLMLECILRRSGSEYDNPYQDSTILIISGVSVFLDGFTEVTWTDHE